MTDPKKLHELALLGKADRRAALLIRILTSLRNCPTTAVERRLALAHYFNWNAQQLGELLEQLEPDGMPDIMKFPPVEAVLDPEVL